MLALFPASSYNKFGLNKTRWGNPAGFLFDLFCLSEYNFYMAKKSKLKDLNQIDAKEETGRPTTLDQIWGDTGISKYGTNDFEDYKSYIRSLNKSDIHAHAMKVGMLPTDNHEILISRLEREFQRHVAAYQAPSETKAKQKKISKDVQKILSEGR
jgi:hypothetical protein